MRVRLLVSMVVTVFAVGCSGDSLSAGDTAEPTPEVEDSAEPKVEDEPVDEDSAPEAEGEADGDEVADVDEVEDWQVALEVAGAPVVFEAAPGITLEILDAQINDVPNAPADVQSSVAMVFDDGPVTPVVGVQMRVTNDTDVDVEWYPDQGTLVLGGISLEPDLFFLSDNLIGQEGLLAGTTSQGDIFYILPEGTDVAGISTAEVRLKGSAPFDAESFESVGAELDVTFAWAPE